MRLPKLAIDNYAFVLILVLMAGSVGVLSFLNMPRYEDPSLNFPIFNVVAVYPGTNPQDMEELVVNPLEEQINEEAARVIALRAPVSKDLRTILTFLRLAASLERIGDYAKNIAKRTAVLVELPPVNGSDAALRRMAVTVL